MPSKKGDWTKIARSMGPMPKPTWASDVRLMRSLVSWGFDILALGKKLHTIGGPGDPPPGFIGGTNSITEWYVYWAMTKLIGKEGEQWSYQQSILGGRHVPGGAVADFVYYAPFQTIIIRVQTWRFHMGAGAGKITTDFEQKIALTTIGGEEITIDIYEQYFVNDETGVAVLEVVKDALAGIEWPNPLATGLAGDW